MVSQWGVERLMVLKQPSVKREQDHITDIRWDIHFNSLTAILRVIVLNIVSFSLSLHSLQMAVMQMTATKDRELRLCDTLKLVQ